MSRLFCMSLFVLMLSTPAVAADDTAVAAAKLVAVTHLKKGDALQEQGKHAEAEQEYDLALASYPESTAVHLSRGQVRFLRKNYTGAIQDFDYYLERVSDDTTVLLLRSLSKSSLKPEDIAGACADLLRARDLGMKLEEAGIAGVDKYCRGQAGWNAN